MALYKSTHHHHHQVNVFLAKLAEMDSSSHLPQELSFFTLTECILSHFLESAYKINLLHLVTVCYSVCQ